MYIELHGILHVQMWQGPNFAIVTLFDANVSDAFPP